MSEQNVARRYARALVQLAVEEGADEAVQFDLARLDDLFRTDGKELYAVLRSPIVKGEERLAVLQAVLPRIGVHSVTSRFLRQLSDADRFKAFGDIVRLYTAAMDERAGRVRVLVTTTEPLTPMMETEIKASFERGTGKKVLLDARIDPTLIGGLVARVGDTVYDASLRTRLTDLKQRLLTSPVGESAPA